MDLGVTKHKCATFSEAEMLAEVGVKDIVLAYNIIGPNLGRTVKFVEKFSHGTLCVTADQHRRSQSRWLARLRRTKPLNRCQRVAVDECWNQTIGFRDQLVAEGWPIPPIVAGGTGSFPPYAERDDPALELSPDTLVFQTCGLLGCCCA